MGVQKAIGICLGASTVSLVEATRGSDGVSTRLLERKEHEGNVQKIFEELFERYRGDAESVAVTGRKFRQIMNFPSLSEPEATEIAYQHLNAAQGYDAIVSAGGETFVVYKIDRMARISQVSSGNKCASGTGEFFLQQIRRMDIDVEKAVELSRTSDNPHHLSGRCSVFCKSDCTHALNKGESIADVTAGLARMIAKKIEELLVKVGARKVLIVGGAAMNPVVIDFLKASFDVVDVPAEASYFEALGAAKWALEKGNRAPIPPKAAYYKPRASSFTFLKPLSRFTDRVEFKEMPFEEPRPNDECVIGLDVGSTTTKAVIFRLADERILKSVYLRTNGNPVKASRECYGSLRERTAGIPLEIVGVGVTGSGRYIAGLHAQTDGIINEIIAHARAATHFDPEVDTIFEIGGQDAKYTFLTNGVASDYAMNEACSAGTGSFLEESAYESLGIAMEDIGEIALKADNPPNFSDQCAAFISSDIKTAFQEGIPRESIVAGLVYSICINYLNRVKGNRQVGGKIFMQGGVCYNKAVPVAMAALSGKGIVVPPHPGLMGAYGVALEIKNLMTLGLLAKSRFDIGALADREVTYGKNFTCFGKNENCDRRCSIAMLQIEGKKFPFGGACNKYYNRLRHKSVDTVALNHVTTRQELAFARFTPPRTDLPADAPTVGINRSFHVNTLYPMFHTFFTTLGCRVVLPETVHQEGIDKGTTSFCLSAQIALGLFQDLVKKKLDYIFIPQLNEIHVSEQKVYRKEFQTVCMFTQGEPYYQRSTFLRNNGKPGPKLLIPLLNLMTGYDAGEEELAKVAVQMGFSETEGRRAAKAGTERQYEFFAALKAEGRRILADLEKDPSRIAIVLFGRPYNAFADETNKGVPFKFASRGVEIIPFDMLEYEKEENFRDTYWEMGQRLVKGARIVARHPQLFGCYLTNFLCALDSIMIPHFRDLMATKPSLTIEVDTHTADAGVNTRIEAFLDVIKNYIKIRDRIPGKVDTYKPSRIELDQRGKLWFHDSHGEKIPFTDKRVKSIVPSMGVTFNTAMVAVVKGLGMNAEALPVCDREALDLGRSVLTGKECLPLLNCVGEFMKYMKCDRDPKERVAFFLAGAGGSCRIGQYKTVVKAIIERLKLPDVAVMTLDSDNGYAGLGIPFRLRAVKAIYAADVMADIRAAINAMAVDKPEGRRIWEREWENICGVFDGTVKKSFYTQLADSVKELSKIKLVRPIDRAKYIGLVGEIFVRRDYFCLAGLMEKLADHGFVVMSAPITEWIRYVDFLRDRKMLVSKQNLVGLLENAVSDFLHTHHENKIKGMLSKSGLYEYELINIKGYIDHSTHYVPWWFTGEPGLSSGAIHYNMVNKWCGVVNAGPFGCMQSRMTEAISTHEFTIDGKERACINAGRMLDLSSIRKNVDVLPFFSVEFDGNPFTQILETRLETFVLQANRLHELMKEQRTG